MCKALRAANLVSKYVWATNARAFGRLLQTAGCIIGVPWYEAWFKPDAHGFVDSGSWAASGVAGGHEIYVEALEAWSDTDPSQCVIRFHNSWNDSWGDHGCGRLRFSTYNQLSSQIDVKQFAR